MEVTEDQEPVIKQRSFSAASSCDSEFNVPLSSGYDEETSGCDEETSGVLSDSENGESDDYAYYQDVYRFVSKLKNEFDRHKEKIPKVDVPKVDWEAIQRKKEEVKEAVINQKEKIKTKSREKIDAGKERIAKLQKKTIKRLKNLRPEENYSLKIIFTKSVLTLILKTFAVCSGQWLLPWYYSVTCPALIAWRVYTYWQNQWQYFCLDFCYFGNLIITLILWLAPSSPELCALQFSLANGMLFLGAFSFRNSIVFHSVDKMTSTYIHTVPILLSFGIRWFPKETARFWHASFPEEHVEASLFWNLLAPFLVMVVHTILYTVLVYIIFKPEEHIITSYRYMRGKKAVKKVFGPNPPYALFVAINWIMALVFSAITMITYQNFYAHVFAMTLELVYIVWNGAGFYVDVFRMSMVRQVKSSDKEE